MNTASRTPAALSADEKRLAKQRAYEEFYRTWFAGKSYEERCALAAMGLDRPESDEDRRRPVEKDGEERLAEIAEPVAPVLTPSEHAALEAAFAAALTWAAQAPNLVEMGRRMSVMLRIYRPALLAGLQIEMEVEMVREFVAAPWQESHEDVGALYGPMLEWVTRGSSLSAWGQRLMAALYVMRPAAIDDRTLAMIGMLSNKTRQAVDRLVQDCRDTFNGIRSRMMRSDKTREKCRQAQLAKA